MKITGSPEISVKIPAAKELGALLKNINPGDLISATVIRSEGNRAFLEIGGKIISAEFTNGVPRDKIIDLVLTAKSPEKIQFALKDDTASGKIFRFLSPFSILQEDEVKINSLQNLARFVNSSKPDLVDINMFLLGMKRDEHKWKSQSSFFNHLLQKGVSLQILTDLAYIIYSKYNPVLFASYRFMMAMAGRKTFFSEKQDLALFEDSIGQFCNLLKEDDSDFSVMLDFIFDDPDSIRIYGDIAYPENGTFSGIEYILNNDSVFLKFDLSSVGELEVFIKSEKDRVLINFLSGKEEALLYIKDKEGTLKSMLEQNGVKKSVIGYFDSKKIVDKIKLWSLDFYTKSEFNVKI